MLHLVGQQGVKYRLQYTTDFSGWNDHSQQTQILDAVDFVDSSGSTSAYRFYRVIVVP